jgi:hypothetical protein
MEAKAQWALKYEQDSIELAAAAVATVKLWELSVWLPMAPLSPTMPLTSSIFKVDEYAKGMQIDARNPDKTVQIQASWNPK